MFLSVAAFVTGILAAALVLVAPLVGAALFGGGATWAFSGSDRGKAVVFAALIGGAVMLLAQSIGTGLAALPRG